MSDIIINHEGTGFDAIEAGGAPRLLALLPPKPMALPGFKKTLGTLDRDLWTTTNRLEQLGEKLPRYDQGQVGSCEICSEIECIGGVRASAGLPPVRLSWAMGYAMTNDGADVGASFGALYPLASEKGVCREETMPPGLYRRSQISAKAYAEAKFFRPTLAYHGASFEEVVTAIIRDDFWPVIGVVVGNNFNTLNDEGCIPLTRGIPNHAVTAADVVRIRSGWGIRFINHWRRSWGIDGNAIISEAAYKAMAYQDAMIYQSVSIDAGIDIPTVVIA
jgi:hypothetical protein